MIAAGDITINAPNSKHLNIYKDLSVGNIVNTDLCIWDLDNKNVSIVIDGNCSIKVKEKDACSGLSVDKWAYADNITDGDSVHNYKIVLPETHWMVNEGSIDKEMTDENVKSPVFKKSVKGYAEEVLAQDDTTEKKQP